MADPTTPNDQFTDPATQAMTRVVVGCYTGASPFGIHRFELRADGRLDRIGTGVAVEHASFLTMRPDTRTLYGVRETADTGAVVALRIDDDGMTPIGEVPSHGALPCHVSTHGDRIYVANYGSGTVAAYALEPDGRIGDLVGRHQHTGAGPHERQDGPHAHCVIPAPDGHSVHVVDLGTDRIVRYSQADDGFVPVAETALPPGTGPRHLRFHPVLPVALIVGELDCTLVVADVDAATGSLHPRAAVPTLPAGTVGRSLAAEVAIHPDGHRAYVSNRGHDSIAVFAIDDLAAHDGVPEPIGHVPSGGRTPRHIAVDPAGRHLLAANQDSDTIVSFELDADGRPHEIGVAAEVSQPVCIEFEGRHP